MHFVLLLPNTCKHSTHVCTALAYNETFQTPMQAICKQNHAINMKWAVCVCVYLQKEARTANCKHSSDLYFVPLLSTTTTTKKNSNSQLLSSVMVVDRQMAKTTTWIIWKHTQSVYKKLCYLWAKKKWLNWFPNWNERQSISIFMLGVFIRLKLISKFSKILLDNLDNTMPTWRWNEKKKNVHK